MEDIKSKNTELKDLVITRMEDMFPIEEEYSAKEHELQKRKQIFKDAKTVSKKA
jgi:hypothetical protein